MAIDKGKIGLLEGERFEAVSLVVGQLAHDLNNLLTPLLAYPPLIKAELPDGAMAKGLVEVVERTARDMAHLTRQLLDLTTRRSFERVSTDVNDVVRRVLAEVRQNPVMDGRTLSTELAGDLEPISVSADRLALALYQVCLNGIEAAGSGGRVEVRTGRVVVEEFRTARGIVVPRGEYVQISITDSGPGISAEIQARLFEPFVTTKKTGGARGAGLGLSVVHRIVSDHGGAVDFECSSTGTVFRVYLPVASAGGAGEAAHGDTAAKSQGETPTRAGRILVVDDERSILKLFQMILGSSLPDHQIDMVSNGREAVEAFGREHHRVILMDLHMPVMDGKAAFTEIERLCQQRNWQMPSVVFCTGFAPPDTIRAVVESNRKHGLLSKPVHSDILVEAIRCRLGA